MKNFEPEMNAGTFVILSASEGFPRRFYKNGRFFAALRMTLILLLVAITLPASAQEGPTPQAILMVANVAGECEILNSMVSFQKKNNMPGGNDYVSQFWASQASQLGLTVEQMADRCNTSTTAYNKLWDAATPKQPAGGNE